ncbi:MAG TPA: prepilin-type N-terminal cleavage/methylation domain-containing protein [Polyangiaceae bacterium]|nr:prepilin-type N-terminal cleavage/methylation domain-containing protein [Polyangiaceae bacterium]
MTILLKKLKKARGFTLVELMIVVVIIGILASLAIYGVNKYIASSKSAEARLGIGAISKGAVTAFEGETMAGSLLAVNTSVGSSRGLCAQSSISSAGVPTAVPAGKIQLASEAWQESTTTDTGKGFSCVKFSMVGPQYYMYRYLSTGGATDGATYSAVANGDLDTDGITSTFSLQGQISTGTLLVAPAVTEVNPSE